MVHEYSEYIQFPTFGTVCTTPLLGMISRIIMISQAIWIEAMTRLGTLEAKFHNMEGGVKPWVDAQGSKGDLILLIEDYPIVGQQLDT